MYVEMMNDYFFILLHMLWLNLIFFNRFHLLWIVIFIPQTIPPPYYLPPWPTTNTMNYHQYHELPTNDWLPRLSVIMAIVRVKRVMVVDRHDYRRSPWLSFTLTIVMITDYPGDRPHWLTIDSTHNRSYYTHIWRNSNLSIYYFLTNSFLLIFLLFWPLAYISRWFDYLGILIFSWMISICDAEFNFWNSILVFSSFAIEYIIPPPYYTGIVTRTW